MPVAPYARLLAALGGGAPSAGGLTTTTGVVIQLSGESTVQWRQQRFEISSYPLGFALPAGWSVDVSTGAYFYATTPTPPPFTTGAWGKYMLRLIVNNGLSSSGQADGTLTDVTTALTIYSPTLGLADLGFAETLQFNAFKLWVGDQQANLRAIETALSGSLTALSSATPAVVGTAGAAGAAITASRGDHAHALPFATVQSVLGVASGAIGINNQTLTGVASLLAGGATSGSGTLNLPNTGSIYAAPAASTVASKPVATWDGTHLAVGDRGLTTGQSVGLFAIASGNPVPSWPGATGYAVIAADQVFDVFMSGNLMFRIDGTKIGFFGGGGAVQPARIGQLADATTGTPGTTLNDVGAVPTQAAINNNFASVLTKLNALDTALHALTLTV